MLSLKTTRRFERDLKRAQRRRKDLEKLWVIVENLREGRQLGSRHKPHRLSGDWNSFWECHIEANWLLIWHVTENVLVLVRTGTHSDLFG